MNLYINLDGSFQNRYYAVDRVNSRGEKTAAEGILGVVGTALTAARVALKLDKIFGGGDDDFGSSTMTTGGFGSLMTN
jgi:hypothetical protein